MAKKIIHVTATEIVIGSINDTGAKIAHFGRKIFYGFIVVFYIP